MDFFAASPFLKALGWALVNSIWQFGICWLLYHALIMAGRNLAAAARHGLALCLLFLGTLSFITELAWTYYASPAISGFPAGTAVTASAYWYNNLHTVGNYADALMPYWSLLYLFCIALLFIKLCFFVRHAGKLQQRGLTKISAAWRCYIKNISAQLGIQKEVKAFLSIHIDTPQVIGFLKPVILVPAACLVNLSTEQLEAVLLHELVHIKRNDYLVNLLIASLEILFFFNPFVKQIAASIRKEREYSCDDRVLQFQYHPCNYASALLTLERNRLIPVTYGIAASGKNHKQLLVRIERLVGIKNRQAGSYKIGAILLTLLLLGFIATIQPVKTVAETSPGKSPAVITVSLNSKKKQSYNLLPDAPPPPESVKPADTKDLYAVAIQNRAARANPEKPGQLTNRNNDTRLATAVLAQDPAVISLALNAAVKETIDFSLPQKQMADVPESPDPFAETEEPFVPASSFSYQLVQDTTLPKIKGQTFSESKAREAMLKTQKALEQINWVTIEKELKFNKQELAKLKKVISLQLQNLNWQKLNTDIHDELSQEQFEKLRDGVNQDQVLKQYRQIEIYNETLRKHLTEQQQMIKASDQRVQESQKATEQEQKKLLLEMKKRRIIYI